MTWPQGGIEKLRGKATPRTLCSDTFTTVYLHYKTSRYLHYTLYTHKGINSHNDTSLRAVRAESLLGHISLILFSKCHICYYIASCYQLSNDINHVSVPTFRQMSPLVLIQEEGEQSIAFAKQKEVCFVASISNCGV